MAVSILACCVVLMLYHHVGYPFLLRLLARRIERRGSFPKPTRALPARSSDPVGRICSFPLTTKSGSYGAR